MALLSDIDTPSLDRYELIEPISSGGMGKVYKACLRGPHAYARIVAVKMIHEHLARDDRFVRMFMDEVAIASQLTHPNICSVLDFGVTDRSYYYVMDYLHGVSVGELGKAVRLSTDPNVKEQWPRIVARLVCDACEGLHAAHELRSPDGALLDVVHRDISPANLHVSFDGTMRVLDFGVASANQRLASSVAGQVKGKYSYMAPEILEGESFDRRADLWSLGVVMWELLAMKRLFTREAPARTMRAVVTDPIPPISERGGTALGLEEIAFKALSRDPEARYESAQLMSRDLNRWLSEGDNLATPNDVAQFLQEVFPDAKVGATWRGSLHPPESLSLDIETMPTVRETTPGLKVVRWLGGVVLVALLGGGGALALNAYVRNGDRSQFSVSAAPVSGVIQGDSDDPTPTPTPSVPPRPSGAPSVEDDNAHPAAEPAPVRPPTPRFGVLELNSRPCWSQVFIDGQDRGPTPMRRRLRVGRHRVRLVPAGRGRAHRFTVQVRGGARVRRAPQVQCP